MFSNLPLYAGDPILGLIGQYQEDKRPQKVNLGVGVYSDDSGKVPMLASVREAERQYLFARSSLSYLPMEGDADYRRAVDLLLFGASPDALSKVSVVQTVGGSGALKVGADFLKAAYPRSRVLVSDPTWDNHIGIFEGASFDVGRYAYFDVETKGLNLPGMLRDLGNARRHDIVLLAPCCHNPTGVDPDRAQWTQILDVMQSRGLIPFIDIAYQGFGEDIASDAWVIRELAARNVDFLVSTSFSKTFSLYGERCGALCVHTSTRSNVEKVLGQLKLSIRRNYSSPPTHGMALVSRVLTNGTLRNQWVEELSGMRDRIRSMRQQFKIALLQRAPQFEASFLTAQRGMFAYTGLTAEQVEALRRESAIYAVNSGRICIAGLNSSNVEYVAQSVAKVL